MTIDHIERDVRDLKKTVNFELKDIYKTIINFKVNIGLLDSCVEKLNEYTHSRVHHLTNTDKGIEMILIHIKARCDAMEKSLKAIDDFSSGVKKRCLDAFFKVIPTATLLLIGIGMLANSHWFKM